MNSSPNNLDRNAGVNAGVHAGVLDAEQTLRLIASLPAPAGIEDRVKSGLRGTPPQSGVIRWPLSSSGRSSGWADASYLRAAAAAAIVLMVAGGGWGVYAHFGQAPAPAAQAVPQRIEGGSGLSTAGAKRTPTTVEGPRIVAPENVRQGMGAGHVSSQPRANGNGRLGKLKPSTPTSAPVVR